MAEEKKEEKKLTKSFFMVDPVNLWVKRVEIPIERFDELEKAAKKLKGSKGSGSKGATEEYIENVKGKLFPATATNAGKTNEKSGVSTSATSEDLSHDGKAKDRAGSSGSATDESLKEKNKEQSAPDKKIPGHDRKTMGGTSKSMRGVPSARAVRSGSVSRVRSEEEEEEEEEE